MSEINLQLAKLIVPSADSLNGLSYLEQYPEHNVYHPGWDLNKGWGNDDLGLPIRCPIEGYVEYVSPKAYNGGFGLHMVIYHEKLGKWTHYVHLDNVTVTVGEKLKKNQLIAHIGKTGTSWAHLHFEVWTKELYEIQPKGWWKKFRFYPSGWEKWKVAQHYMNPEEFLQLCVDLKPEEKKEPFRLPHWALRAVEWNNNLNPRPISNVDKPLFRYYSHKI